EKFSLSRIYPNLVSMHAIRGSFKNHFSYLVAGEMAAHMIPLFYNLFFCSSSLNDLYCISNGPITWRL
ncbi:hypothetical protein, partial [Orientia tsutsugamushi]|uniref:hypothetical protein n=1 Tax=Orientia tsutsugamushi TaxID=784 RepID=UPI0020927E0F